jgi:hypothetical protein
MTTADAIPAAPVERSRPSAPLRAGGRAGRVLTPITALTVPPSLGPASERDARIQRRVEHVDQGVDQDERRDQDQ